MSEGPMLTPSAIEGAFETMPDSDRAYRHQLYRVPRPFAGGDDSLSRPPEYTETTRKPEYLEMVGDLQEMGYDDSLGRAWGVDPYESDPETTAHFVDSYFANVNEGLCYIFPRAPFILWLKSFPSKSAHEKMLLYSMMALGAIFSDRPDRSMAVRRYSRVARFAVLKSHRNLSLQLAQSHLILSLLHYATGSLIESWDSVGAAGRVMTGLRYNVESGGLDSDQNQACDYGLHPQALIECRRRTFWVAFALDVRSGVLATRQTRSIELTGI